ncbi:glycosyltransferase [Clostridium fallax]|uniref:Glycosyltransferase involved in cell wall bisynthesis n=1 Tax=Clostridium fallax TaxID=1533 RepID=A0A1M4VPM6_9CLOT|nr:glycosyltransferase [Clostridium fallax]SHE70919.1 Glycosyltransferase involved in cell wall bisynthesis [Clostridium fallax]SQB22825.1 capsular polysaccharide biosynthesis protein [Clostridium fallax]
MTKKVMHIVSTGRLSGAEKVVSDICSNLTEDFKPIAICAGEELKKYYEEKGIETHIFNISSLNPFEILKLKNFAKKNNIDIIHGHDVKPSIAGYLASSSNIPVISHLHGTYPWLKGNGAMKKIDGFFRSKYAMNIACSNKVKDYYLTYNKKINSNKFVVKSNAFNFNEFNNIKIREKNIVKDELDIKEDDFIFGYVGRLIPLKGIDLLINAFNDILKERDNVKLLIVGDGDERENLKIQAERLGIRDKIIFTGFKRNVYEYMNIMDCFVLSSVREGLPMVILESIAMNIPIISTPVAGVNELISSNEYGIVLKERNKENMVLAMKDALLNRDEFKIKASNAYKKLKEQYDIDIYIKDLEKLYKDII